MSINNSIMEAPASPEPSPDGILRDMANNNTNEQTSTIREFRYSHGYYYYEPESKELLIWHGCTTRPMYVSHSHFRQLFYKPSKEFNFDCPNCGKPVSRWDSMWRAGDDDDNYIGIQLCARELERVSIGDHTVSIGIFTSYYTLREGASLFVKETYYRRFTINVKTGYSYQFAKKTLNKKNDINKNRGLRNISYFGTDPDGDLLADTLNCIKHIINDKMKAAHGENVPSFESYDIELSLDNLIFYVRNPYICPTLYNGIINASRRNMFHPLRLKEVLVKNDCREPLQQMFSQSRIPNVKSLRKLAFTDAWGFSLLASIARTFRNVDVIRSLYSAYIVGRPSIEDSAYVDFSANIFKKMIKHKGEKNIALKLLSFIKHDKNNNACQTLYDMTQFYDKLKHCDFDFSGKYSIDELHLYLAAAVSDQESENREIPYAKNELSLETSDDTFSLSLAKDTHELINVGEEMSICVGGYADDAADGNCFIFILRNLADRSPIGCIEIRNSAVRQAKGANNKLLQNRERDFVKNWAVDKGFYIATKDLTAISA